LPGFRQPGGKNLQASRGQGRQDSGITGIPPRTMAGLTRWHATLDPDADTVLRHG